jgi:hypothetical protein
MKRSRNTLILVLAIFLLLGSLPVAAVERPLALHGEGNVNLSAGTLAASGTASHLGHWTQIGTISFTPISETVILASGEVTFTAANGDTLHATFANAVLNITTTDPSTGIATGVFVFDGGTGRFDGVSGSGDFVVMQNLDTGDFELTGVGTLDY